MKVRQGLYEGYIRVIYSKKAHGLVFIEVVVELESIVQLLLPYLIQPRISTASCIPFTCSGLLMGTEKRLAIKSGPTRHYTLSVYISKPYFDAARCSRWSVFQPSSPQTAGPFRNMVCKFCESCLFIKNEL